MPSKLATQLPYKVNKSFDSCQPSKEVRTISLQTSDEKSGLASFPQEETPYLIESSPEAAPVVTKQAPKPKHPFLLQGAVKPSATIQRLLNASNKGGDLLRTSCQLSQYTFNGGQQNNKCN